VQPGWLEGDSLERTRLPSYLLYLAKTGLLVFELARTGLSIYAAGWAYLTEVSGLDSNDVHAKFLEFQSEDLRDRKPAQQCPSIVRLQHEPHYSLLLFLDVIYFFLFTRKYC
jgi:hypothetical protein